MSITRVTSATVQAFANTARFVSSCGGTRSGKTFAALQTLYFVALADEVPTLTSVVSETFPHLKRGAIRDFQRVLVDLGRWDASAWSKSDSMYTLPNGSRIEFFSADSPAKVHGPARDRLFINEVQNIGYDTARQLFVRTTGKIILDYNPTHSFWANEVMEAREDCVCIHSTYEDNKDIETGQSLLSDAQIREIESNRNDANWWRVYGEGKVGVLEGIIYDFEQVDHLPDSTEMVDVYGMDFGFTNDPTTLIHCLIDRGNKVLHLDEEFYRAGMLNADIAAAMDEAGVPKGTAPIYADCAEPKTIEELYRYGYNILPSYKATRKAEQIQALKGYSIKVTKRSTNLIREMRSYAWAQDKNGNRLNEPIAWGDHAMDAFRYGAYGYINSAGADTIYMGFGSDYGWD